MQLSDFEMKNIFILDMIELKKRIHSILDVDL